MAMALIFNDVPLTPITHQNSLWIRAAELARALGYAQENSVSRLYRNNADEFTPEMTQVIEMSVESRNGSSENLLDGRCRIFSLRGCHLVAMFARTQVAKSFRRWVLDVLDKLAEQERARLAGETKEIPDASRVSKRTDPERKALTAIINTWVGLAPIHYASARAQVNAHFGVASVDALTVAQVKEALRFVQGKIDALPPVVTEPVRLPMYRDGIFHSVHTDKKHVAGPREEALKDFWSKEYGPQSAALEDKFREMLDAIDKAAGADLFSYAVSAIGRDADTSFGVSCLLDGMYAAKYMARSAFKDAMSYLCLHMRMATSVATALNR